MNTSRFSFLVVLAALSTPHAQPKAIVPIVDVKFGYLLGASRGREWLKPKATAPSMKTGATLRVFSATRALGTARATRPKSMDAPCSNALWSTLSPNFKTQNAQFALGGTHNPFPRTVRIEKTDQEAYRRVVATILKARGIAQPKVQITQLWRVDLDGDGTLEVLLSATRKADYGDPERITSSSRAGDYSLVLLRKIVSGQVRNIVVEGQFHPQSKRFDAANFYQLGAVLDADGDGILEVLVRGRYYEGEWTSLYGLQGAKPREVLTEGCGS